MPAPTRFSELLYRYIDRAEGLMLVLMIAGVVSHFQGLSFANTLMIVAFLGLAGVFFLNAFRLPTATVDEKEYQPGYLSLLTQTIVPKVLWILSAIGALGLALVHMQTQEGAYQRMFMIQGMGTLSGLLLIGLAAAQGRNIQHLIPILYRAIPLTLFGAHFLGYY